MRKGGKGKSSNRGKKSSRSSRKKGTRGLWGTPVGTSRGQRLKSSGKDMLAEKGGGELVLNPFFSKSGERREKKRDDGEGKKGEKDCRSNKGRRILKKKRIPFTGT